MSAHPYSSTTATAGAAKGTDDAERRLATEGPASRLRRLDFDAQQPGTCDVCGRTAPVGVSYGAVVEVLCSECHADLLLEEAS